jgi:hypothetical protein
MVDWYWQKHEANRTEDVRHADCYDSSQLNIKIPRKVTIGLYALRTIATSIVRAFQETITILAR